MGAKIGLGCAPVGRGHRKAGPTKLAGRARPTRLMRFAQRILHRGGYDLRVSASQHALSAGYYPVEYFAFGNLHS